MVTQTSATTARIDRLSQGPGVAVANQMNVSANRNGSRRSDTDTSLVVTGRKK